MTPTPEFADFEAPAEPPPVSELGRLVGVFFSPGQAFADIAKRPRWWVPLVLSILATSIFLYLYSQHVGWEQLFRQQMEQSPQTQNLTPQQREQALLLQARIAPYLTFGAGIFSPIISALIIAGVLKFLADTIMGAGIGFKNTLAAVTYGSLPNVLVAGLSTLVMYLKPPEEFNLQNPLMFNLGAYLGADVTPWVKQAATSLDLFSFWSMLLIAMGIAAASRRMTTGRAFGMILFPWALVVIVRAGATAAFR